MVDKIEFQFFLVDPIYLKLFFLLFFAFFTHSSFVLRILPHYFGIVSYNSLIVTIQNSEEECVIQTKNESKMQKNNSN